jgi:hypothetical protein
MKKNLDSLRSEIEEYLETRGIALFHGCPRSGEHGSAVYWDTERHPDYQGFLAAAEAAGVRVVTLFSRELEEELIDDALEQLESSGLDRDDRRSAEVRLKELRGYTGFTCQIELSFDVAPRVYIFDLRTEWLDELNDLIERIEESYSPDEDSEEGLSGGYFSRN